MNKKSIITCAMSGAGTFKQNNPAVPYTPEEFADEAEKACRAGAAIVHVHARDDNGMATHDIGRIRATHDAIRERVPGVIVNLSSAVGPLATPEQRIEQILEIRPEMASLNTNTMNFSIIDRKTGAIVFDNVFTNTFTMLRDFGRAMEENGVKPEVEVYDMGGLDNFLLIDRQGIFSSPYAFNFVWGVAGGQRFRPEVFAALVKAIPAEANFTACGIGPDQFFACMQSCIMGGHLRVGLEDNTRMPGGELARGNYELVEWAAALVRSLGREPATPDEARKILGLGKNSA
ncbi:MAG TPA: 3-keto-5-aminohexanoate cleavage protein [Spirochaetota bacterium]|nr:3-keto-5-aminohexanoate cleavage protein [Spirochaetota bacterium]